MGLGLPEYLTKLQEAWCDSRPWVCHTNDFILFFKDLALVFFLSLPCRFANDFVLYVSSQTSSWSNESCSSRSSCPGFVFSTFQRCSLYHPSLFCTVSFCCVCMQHSIGFRLFILESLKHLLLGSCGLLFKLDCKCMWKKLASKFMEPNNRMTISWIKVFSFSYCSEKPIVEIEWEQSWVKLEVVVLVCSE